MKTGKKKDRDYIAINVRFHTHSSAYFYEQYSIDVIVRNNLFTREDGLSRMIYDCVSSVAHSSLEVLTGC
jgi:hypothetical protein